MSPEPKRSKIVGSAGHYTAHIVTWRMGMIRIPIRVEEDGPVLRVYMECPVEQGYHERVSCALHACSTALFLLALHINEIENGAFAIGPDGSAYIGPVKLTARVV